MANSNSSLNPKSFWYQFITAGIDESNPHLYSRILLLNSFLYVATLIQFSFVFFHFFISHNLSLMIANGLGVSLLIPAILYVRKTKSILLAGHLASIGVLLFFLFFLPETQNQDLSIAWVFLVPIFVVMLNGWKIGLFYVLLLYLYAVPMAYSGIGVWQSGVWSELSFVRFLAVLTISSLMAILIDFSQYLSNNRELKIRAKEAKYLSELRTLSITDALTGLYNRHYLNQIITSKIARVKGQNHCLIFFIVDIDWFKKYNDYYGHQAGDVVIKKVADCIRDYVHRENDLVFRLGGEEFGGLVESRNIKETQQWLTKMVDEISKIQIPHSPEVSQPFVTISMGVAASSLVDMDSFQHLYKEADEALYEAKQAGRNRAIIHSDCLENEIEKFA
ncbi:MAG TPA: GGDEF domain-containing protein [Thiomicrospira sp.]|jgi:diguanylate cyclase (GGDEF)-like protein|nr:GGDEF domain-containing protein [Thiomicrospira sp.]